MNPTPRSISPDQPELTPEQRQRAHHAAEVAMVRAAADRRTVTALTLDGRRITGTLVWWPSPDRNNQCQGRRAKVQLPGGAWLAIVTRRDTITIHDREPAQ